MSCINSFLNHFRKVEDPRIDGLVTYPLDEILLATLCAVLCRNQDWEEISYWAEHHIDWLRQFLGYSNGIPAPQTFARIFNSLDSKLFKTCFEAWTNSLGVSLKNQQIAIDGKTARGSKKSSDGSEAIHLVSAFAHEAGLVIGQEKVDDKSNEITAIPQLLKRLAIEGCTITIDAIGTQKEIVKEIINRKAEYVLALKNNQKTLYEDVELFFNERSKDTIWDEFEETDAGHGRIEVRKCIITSDIEWLKEEHPDWKNLRSIAMVDSLRINKKTLTRSRERRYYISSLPAKAKDMSGYIRNHWSVENKLHWVLDMTFKEGSCRTRTDHGAENLATIRKVALNALKRFDTTRISLKKKLLKGNWDLNYLKSLISS